MLSTGIHPSAASHSRQASRYRKPREPTPKEFALQLAVADHLRAFAHTDWRWSPYPAGEKRDPRAAAKLRAMGLQRGWPDFLLIAPGGRLHALELKHRGEDMTEEQEGFAPWCHEQGVPFACTDNLREALMILTSWEERDQPCLRMREELAKESR